MTRKANSPLVWVAAGSNVIGLAAFPFRQCLPPHLRWVAASSVLGSTRPYVDNPAIQVNNSRQQG